MPVATLVSWCERSAVFFSDNIISDQRGQLKIDTDTVVKCHLNKDVQDLDLLLPVARSSVKSDKFDKSLKMQIQDYALKLLLVYECNHTKSMPRCFELLV